MKDLRVSAAAAGECAQIRSRIVERLAEPHAVTLRVNLSDFAIPGDVNLEKAAFVQVRSVRDRLNLNEELRIEFVPASAAAISTERSMSLRERKKANRSSSYAVPTSRRSASPERPSTQRSAH